MCIYISESKHGIIAKLSLISTLSLLVLQNILLVVVSSWDSTYFFVYLLPIIMTGLLFNYKTIIGEKKYQRILAIPLALILVIQIITLLVKIKSLEVYSSESAILYNFTTWKYILLYVINCGPSAVAIVSLLIAGTISSLKKEKSALPSIFMCITVIIRLLDGVSLLIRGLDLYLQQFGVEYVLFLVVSILADIFVMMCFAVLMFPNSLEKPLVTNSE